MIKLPARTIGGSPGMGGGGGALLPSQVPGLSLWLRADQGVTLGGGIVTYNREGTGPTPANVTWTGAPAANLNNIILQIVAGGVLGTSTFAYSVNGAAFSAPIATGSNIAIPGTGSPSPAMVSFAAGTYVANDDYLAGPTVASWTSIASASVFTQATPSDQPVYTPFGVNNQDSLVFDGVARILKDTAYPAFGQPWTIFVAAQMFSEPSAEGLLFAQQAGGWLVGVVTGGEYFVINGGDEAAQSQQTLVNPFVISGVVNGATSIVPACGGTVTNLGATTSAQGLTIGGYNSGDYFPGLIGEIVLYKSALTFAQRSGLMQYFAARYGLS